MAVTNYHKLTREALRTVLETITNIDSVYSYRKAYEECSTFPSVSFYLESSKTDRQSPNTLSCIIEDIYTVYVYTQSSASLSASEQIEELDSQIRQALEDSNRLGDQSTTLGASFQWVDYDLVGISINPEKDDESQALAELTVTARYRRNYR